MSDSGSLTSAQYGAWSGLARDRRQGQNKMNVERMHVRPQYYARSWEQDVCLLRSSNNRHLAYRHLTLYIAAWWTSPSLRSYIYVRTMWTRAATRRARRSYLVSLPPSCMIRSALLYCVDIYGCILKLFNRNLGPEFGWNFLTAATYTDWSPGSADYHSGLEIMLHILVVAFSFKSWPWIFKQEWLGY
jgi:hypothetical protein